jgi:hypothetical protein
MMEMEVVNQNPVYRYRVLEGPDGRLELADPPQYFYWDDWSDGCLTLDPTQSYTSSSNEAMCTSFLGGYWVVPELVDGSKS